MISCSTGRCARPLREQTELAAKEGIEPSTIRLTGERSTSELLRIIRLVFDYLGIHRSSCVACSFIDVRVREMRF